MAFDYRALNAPIQRATLQQLQRLGQFVNFRDRPRIKPIAKPPVIRRRKTRVNDSYKVAMVALRFGSLTNFSKTL